MAAVQSRSHEPDSSNAHYCIAVLSGSPLFRAGTATRSPSSFPFLAHHDAMDDDRTTGRQRSVRPARDRRDCPFSIIRPDDRPGRRPSAASAYGKWRITAWRQHPIAAHVACVRLPVISRSETVRREPGLLNGTSRASTIWKVTSCWPTSSLSSGTASSPLTPLSGMSMV